MSRPRNPTEQQRAIRTSITLLTRLQPDHPKLVNRLRDWAGTTTSGNGPKAKNTISDPTGNAALAIDHWGIARTELDRQIATIYTATLRIEQIRRDVMDTDTDDPDKPNQRTATLQPCANEHGCPDEAWAAKAGRCDTCYQYRRRNDRDRRAAGQTRGPRQTDNDPTANA